jgi:hypothetical protein
LTLSSTSAIENVIGSEFADDIRGNNRANTIQGRRGDDATDAKGGNDSLDGGDGNDTLLGGDGCDTINGGIGNDKLYGGADDDFLDGGDGDDLVYGEGGDDKLLGHAGIDKLYGGDGDDAILGQAGNDYAEGGRGRDLMDGGTGDDELHGNEDNDVVLGGTGLDRLYGEDGSDLLDGEDGDDKLYGGNGDDILVGGAGADYLSGDADKDRLEGGLGVDTLVSDVKDIVVEQETKAVSFALKSYFQTFAAQHGLSDFFYRDPTNGSTTAVDRPVRAWIAAYEATIPGSGDNMVTDAMGEGSGEGRINATMLAPLVDAAIEGWALILGAGDPRLQALAGVQVSVADLDGTALGETLGKMIKLDADAAGHGWFVDLTPFDSAEFELHVDGNLVAGHASPAFARMDLLTTLMHEMGHAMGLEHGDGEHGVMDAELDPGVRYLLDVFRQVDHDPHSPLDDRTLVEIANAALHPQTVKDAVQRNFAAFEIDPSAPQPPGHVSIDWNAALQNGWSVSYSPYAAKPAQSSPGNFSDFLVKAFQSGDSIRTDTPSGEYDILADALRGRKIDKARTQRLQ